MIIPGLDLMRLFTVRIFAGKNPFFIRQKSPTSFIIKEIFFIKNSYCNSSIDYIAVTTQLYL